MNPIAELRDKLIEFPEIRFMAEANLLAVFPADEEGFPVVIERDDNGYLVWFSGWHEHFAEPEHAFNCFTFGLSDDCRLEIDRRGDREYRWTIETLENGTWVAGKTVTRRWVPFWKRRDVVHRQNRFLQADTEEK